MPNHNDAGVSRLLDGHPAGSTALVYGGRRLTYAELSASTENLAAQMSELAGERVAFMLPNCPEAVLVYLACFRAGALAVPLNTRYAPPEVARVVRRCRPRWLIVHDSRLERLSDLDPETLRDLRVITVGGGESGHEAFFTLLAPPPAASAAPTAPWPQPQADVPAVMFFTSGSTGTPKGVVHSQRSVRGILHSTSAAMADFTTDDVVLVSDPLVHISGFMESMTTLMSGGTIALYDGFHLPTYVAGLLEHRPTLICTHLDVLAQLARDPRAEPAWFSSLRGVYTGGDTVSAAVHRDFMASFGKAIGVGWGLTEAIWLTVNREPRLDRDGCIGTPVGGAAVRRDETTGELLAQGPMVMSGYWEDDALTSETLADGWLHTGDIGSQDATGVWWYEGRIKDLIVRRTSKITPGEIEAAIDQHRDVVASAVVAASDPVEGQVPVAFVVRRPGQELTADELMRFLQGVIAEYKLPERIHFVEALPLTVSGKIAHHELHEPD